MSDYLPSEKSPAIERLLETLTGRTSAIEQGVCATCGKCQGKLRLEQAESNYFGKLARCESCNQLWSFSENEDLCGVLNEKTSEERI